MNPHFTLAEVHPYATLMVMLDTSGNNEWGFIKGAALRSNWEDKDIKRIGETTKVPEGAMRCLCPDGRHAIVKFLAEDFQLMHVEKDPLGSARDTNMPTQVKRKAPPKAGAKKPAASTKTGGDKPAATKPAAAAKVVKTGGYPYMLKRIKAQLLKKRTGDNRSEIRTGIEPLETYLKVRDFAIKATVVKDQADWDSFMNEVVAEAVSGGE
jgi:hypothetical protein